MSIVYPSFGEAEKENVQRDKEKIIEQTQRGVDVAERETNSQIPEERSRF